MGMAYIDKLTKIINTTAKRGNKEKTRVRTRSIG